MGLVNEIKGLLKGEHPKGGLKDVVLHLAASSMIVKGTVPEAEAERRMQKCLGCDKRLPEENKCGVCLCFLDLKTRSKINRNPKKLRNNEVTHCPLGRWGDRETANIYREMDGLAPLES